MLPLAFGFGGPWDVAIVAGLVLVLFGSTKIAGLGKSLGEGIKEFKKATNEDDKVAPPPAMPAASYPQEPQVTAGVKTEEKP